MAWEADMAGYSIQEIEVGKLLLDVKNPRHDVLSGQTETLHEIMLDQKDKLVKLAKDIVDFGPNPSELSIVIPSEDDSDKFVVAEGNRRLAALMLLSDPAMAALGYEPKDVNKFEAYGEKYKSSPIESLACVVFSQRAEANHWIELRHTGENEGRGVVPWGAKEKARFNELQGKPSPAFQVLEFVKKNANLSKEDLEYLMKPNISSIKRLISDPNVREALGVDITDGYVNTNYPSGEIINGLTKLVMDVATQGISVDDIRHKRDREEYISGFADEYLPDITSKPVKTWELRSQTGPVKPSILPSKGVTGTTPGKKSVPLSTSRKTLIPSKCVLKVKNAPRINKIYRELRDLEIDFFENSGAVMFRVFLELSLEEYARRNQIPFDKNTGLSAMLQKVANYMKSNKLMTPNELKPIRVAYSSKDSLFSSDTLHAYVHNPDFAPKSQDLKITWDGFEKFFMAMWS
jgi:hypothetical protein